MKNESCYAVSPEEQLAVIRTALEAAKADPELKQLTVGGGKNFKRLYERKIELVEAKLRAAFQ